MPRSVATTGAETMLTVGSCGCSTPASAAAVSARVFISATSPSYSMTMPRDGVFGELAGERAELLGERDERASGAALPRPMIDGMLSAFETAPVIR